VREEVPTWADAATFAAAMVCVCERERQREGEGIACARACAFLSVCVYVNLHVCMHKCVFFSECASRQMFSISEQSYQVIHLYYVLCYALTSWTSFVLVLMYSHTYDRCVCVCVCVCVTYI